MKNSQKLINIVTASLLAALCCVGTLVLQIPTPTGGFVNLGDTIILLSAFLLSPVYAALSAGIGSMLADIIAGYPQYAPATFVIKALMGLVACLIFSAVAKSTAKKNFLTPVFCVIAGVCAEAIMIAGYFVFEAIILSYGLGAIASVVPNTIQGVAGIIGGTILCTIIDRTKIKNKLNP